MAQKVIVPQKKIMSRIFLNSGTLIVILVRSEMENTLLEKFWPILLYVPDDAIAKLYVT